MRSSNKKSRQSSSRSVTRRLGSLAAGAVLTGCTLIKPLPPETSLAHRLAAFPCHDLPLKDRAVIRWSDEQIPFIEATSDEDAAFALGLVHAHLRLGQMAIYRHIALGRLSELGGPLANDIDQGIRILDFGRAAAAMEAAMLPETLAWMNAFVAGINHYQATTQELPYEYAVLGITRKPWTVRDILAFGRLAGTDVNWLVWFNLLKLRERPDWPEIWRRLIDGGDAVGRESLGADRHPDLASVLTDIARSGSNSLVISPDRSASGGALIANDPHLGINLPNIWLIAGIKSPSYHTVGLMVPGLPFFAIGRNPWIAWGGTNMRASSSDLVDVSALPRDAFFQREEVIRTRWWRNKKVTVRETAWGPVISDVPQLRRLNLPDVALHWMGHNVSDEVTAMLRVARSRTFDEFREAFGSFAVSGQTMLYADHAGNIGKVYGTRVPDRGGSPPPDIILSPEEASRTWQTIVGALDLPTPSNPEDGYIVSANNRPPEVNINVGYFYSPDDRVERMSELIQENQRLDIEDLKRLQQDVHASSSAALNRLLIDRMEELGTAANATPEERKILELMKGWNGDYERDSPAPVAFELFRYTFTLAFYQRIFGETDWAAFAGVGRIKAILLQDIADTDRQTLAPMLKQSLAEAAERADDFPTWGDMHRLMLGHPLRYLPLIGSRFQFSDDPAGGTTESIAKTAHALTDERHNTRYGASARHISDMSDVDQNFFVLLGGQDGWLRSSTFMDQVQLWRDCRYIQVPLSDEGVRRAFPHETILTPRSTGR